MGWEGRARGGLYYTRSRREGDRVVRKYIGTGVFGEIAALEDEEQRDRRQVQRDALRRVSEELMTADQALDALDVWSHRLISGHLLIEGFHQHDRGEWRKRRGKHE